MKPASITIDPAAPPEDIVVKFREGSAVARGHSRLGGPDAVRALQVFRDHRNSHAIICGAGYPPNPGTPDRYSLGFYNYGSRVNLQGYGIQVYTTGYGDLYNGGSQDSGYTSGFSGTSSASPTDPLCPHATRADFNCDRVTDVHDVLYAINFVFTNGPPPWDPCQ